jgi:hypothetical protein
LRVPGRSAYHYGMQKLGWTLVFTADSLDHLAERDIEAEDVADAVFGRYALARVRRGGARCFDEVVRGGSFG